MKLFSLTITVSLVLIACASPTVVTERQAGDQNLSCSALVAAIQEAEEDEAREDRGVTGTNAAAVVFVWPGLLGTYANTEAARDAAQDRQEHLIGIYGQNNCGSATGSSDGDITNQLRELRSMFDEGLITGEEYNAARARFLGI